MRYVSEVRNPTPVSLSRDVMAAARDMYHQKPMKKLARKFLMDGMRWHANNLSSYGMNDHANRVYDELNQHCSEQPRLKEIQALIDADQHYLARIHLEQHLKIYDTDIAALSMWGKLAEQQEKRHEAIRAYKRLIDIAPGFLDAYYAIMPLAYQAGKYDLVDLAMSAIHKISPENVELIDL